MATPHLRLFRSPNCGSTSGFALLSSGSSGLDLLVHHGFEGPFGLAFRLWCVGPGALVSQFQSLTGLPSEFALIGADVFRELPQSLNPLAAQPGHSPDQET